MTNVALFNFTPKFCPSCGNQIHFIRLTGRPRDYEQYDAFACQVCKLLYQKATSEDIITAADNSRGDLRRYV